MGIQVESIVRRLDTRLLINKRLNKIEFFRTNTYFDGIRYLPHIRNTAESIQKIAKCLHQYICRLVSHECKHSALKLFEICVIHSVFRSLIREHLEGFVWRRSDE